MKPSGEKSWENVLAGKVLRDSRSLDKKLEFGVWRFGVVSAIKRVMVIYWSLDSLWSLDLAVWRRFLLGRSQQERCLLIF